MSEPDLRAAVLAAATAHGSDGKGTDGLKGYLEKLAVECPEAFAELLAAALTEAVTTAIVEPTSILRFKDH
jgi:hypothetical protein